MKTTQLLILSAATFIAVVFPARAVGKDPESHEAGKRIGEAPGTPTTFLGTQLDTCRDKLLAKVRTKHGGLMDSRDELQREYMEKRRIRLDSNRELRKIEAELREKIEKLRKEKGRGDQKSRSEIERLVRESRMLKKSLTGTGELKQMAEQLESMQANIDVSTSEAFREEPGCLEYKAELTRELGPSGRHLGSALSGAEKKGKTIE